MWNIDEETVRGELGPKELECLEKLRAWLYPSQLGKPLKFRSAPSPIVRCEAELLNMSMPRFAFRAYLTPRSFVNARRIETFAQMAAPWGEPPQGYGDRVDWQHWNDPNRSPGDIIRRASCIGDSLLELREKVHQKARYRLLTCELGRAYGEHEIIEGTPFVRHIRLGGGMCGQATCFMATALLQAEARGIYGVAEITALASDQDGPAISISGMNLDKMCHYFNHRAVGLSASHQLLQCNVPQNLVPDFGEALFAYCASGMPVILKVDLGRMCGVEYSANKNDPPVKADYLFKSNDLEDLETVVTCRKNAGGNSKQPRPHAVLVVGCQAKKAQKANGPLHFLINDPATYPFLEADAATLAHVRHYDHANWKTGKLGQPEFIAITPQAVRLPLLDVPNDRDKEHPWTGLKQIAFNVLASHEIPEFRDFEFPAVPAAIGVQTRLIDLHWCREKDGENEKEGSRFHRRAADIPEDIRNELLRLTHDGVLAPKWCWICHGISELADNRTLDSVFVWDATVPPPPLELSSQELMHKYLLAALTKEPNGTKWDERYVRPAALRPALISSFHTGAVPVVFKEWPAGLDHGPATDLYVFMKQEVDNWLAHHSLPSNPPVDANHPVAVMARIAQEPREKRDKIIDDWAAEICRSFSPPNVVAISSFVPEVSSPRFELQNTACSAIRFLMELAHALRLRGHTQLRTVEMVMGSRIGGIWPSGNGDYSATRLEVEAARFRTLGVLARAMAPYADLAAADRIAVAIELEPGPLFLLHNWQSLLDLCRDIDKDPLLSRFVGVNLDIAHWRLARDVSPALVWDSPEVRNRIVHAHISGHHRCIHGDLPPGDLNDAGDFQPWLELLERIASDWRPSELPQFSGHVSLEIEAAKNKTIVSESVNQVVQLLKHRI